MDKCRQQILNPNKSQMSRIKDKIQQILSLITCLLIITSVAIVHEGKYFGHELRQDNKTAKTATDTIRMQKDGSTVINTTSLAGDITGYGGKVPLEITVDNGVIKDVKPLDNSETPEFFEKASTLLDRWKGKTVEEAADMKVDAISGATMSSDAIIANMQRGLEFVMNRDPDTHSGSQGWLSAKNMAGLIVALMAAILPLIVKSRRYHTVQLILNTVVLGFWCGNFISWSSMISYMSNGINIYATFVPVIMLITAFVYPLFGKKTYFCAHMCPFGSLQQLAGKPVRYKVPISRGTLRRLDMFRQLLWAVLMLCIWSGAWAGWTGYEPFAAFMFGSASWYVIAVAVIFVLLSVVVTRPYCRFICPVGTLLKLSQTSK